MRPKRLSIEELLCLAALVNADVAVLQLQNMNRTEPETVAAHAQEMHEWPSIATLRQALRDRGVVC